MIKTILLSLILSIIPLSALSQSAAQNDQAAQRLDQIKSMKIGYMSEQMKLTSTQSVAFWPLYNEYWQARYELFECKRKAQIKIRAGAATSSDIDELIRVEDQQAKLMKSFAARFEKVISIDQTAKMFVAEEEFKSVLLKTLK